MVNESGNEIENEDEEVQKKRRATINSGIAVLEVSHYEFQDIKLFDNEVHDKKRDKKKWLIYQDSPYYTIW